MFGIWVSFGVSMVAKCVGYKSGSDWLIDWYKLIVVVTF